MLADFGLLAAGALCAGVGGELFVRGAVRVAAWLRIRPGLIGATVAAFATSAPELAVAVTAAVEGAPAVALHPPRRGARLVPLGRTKVGLLRHQPVDDPGPAAEDHEVP